MIDVTDSANLMPCSSTQRSLLHVARVRSSVCLAEWRGQDDSDEILTATFSRIADRQPLTLGRFDRYAGGAETDRLSARKCAALPELSVQAYLKMMPSCANFPRLTSRNTSPKAIRATDLADH